MVFTGKRPNRKNATSEDPWPLYGATDALFWRTKRLHALHVRFGRIAAYAMHGAVEMVLVNVMRIPCFGLRITIGRASIV
jgi:hypothetical protein